MAESKQRAAWNHTSQLLSLVANAASCGEKIFSPSDFNPFSLEEEDAEEVPNPFGFGVLKYIFGRDHKAKGK
jgi:hypothetical protein